MKRRRFLTGIMLAFTLILAINPAYAEEQIISQVEVQVKTTGFPGVNPLLSQRIQEAVSVVAAKALVGQEVGLTAQFQEDFRRSLAQVFASTITGFSLERLELIPGPVAVVEASFRPSGTRIREVSTDWILTAPMPDLVTAEIQHQVERSMASLSRIYQGVPVDSLSWSGAALKREAQELLPQIPGFTSSLEVKTSAQTELQVIISPAEPRIYEIQISPDSATLPPALLRQFSAQLRTELAMLNGLPVEYAKSQENELIQFLEQRLRATTPITRGGVSYKIRLGWAPVTRAAVTVDSLEYKLSFEGFVNFGVEVKPGMHLELGRYLSPVVRGIVGVELPATTLELRPLVGVGAEVFNGDLVLLYSVSEHSPQLRFEYELDRGQRVRLKRDWSQPDWELSYGVKTAEYLTTELVASSDSLWFRLVGSL